jgi:hypothetical protein
MYYPRIQEGDDIDTRSYPISIECVYLKYRHHMAMVVLSRTPEKKYILMGKIVCGTPDFTKSVKYTTLQEAHIFNVTCDPENIRWICKPDENGEYLTKDNADNIFMQDRVVQIKSHDYIVMEEDITPSIKRQILDKVQEILINECGCSVIEE